MSAPIRSLSQYETAIANAPDRYSVVTVYERAQIINDKGQRVWRQTVIGRKVMDEKGHVAYYDDTARPFR